jgi:hypothetical protein
MTKTVVDKNTDIVHSMYKNNIEIKELITSVSERERGCPVCFCVSKALLTKFEIFLFFY